MTTATLTRHDRSLNTVVAELERQIDAANDYVADTRRMGFDLPAVYDGTGPVPLPAPTPTITIDDVEGEFALNDHAQHQMAARLEIPRRFWDRLRDNHPDILTDAVRKLMVREPEVRMVRTLDQTARAYLSNRYRRLDNYDLMDRAVLPVLHENGPERMIVLKANLTDTRMYLKVLFPEVTFTPPDGQELHGGVVIGNSEVGAGSLFVDPFMYRSFCFNGLVFGAQSFADYGLRKTHIGRAIDDNEQARRSALDELAVL